MASKKVQTKVVRLVGGPLHGQQATLARSAERMRVFTFEYDYAGKHEGEEHFAIVPRKRKLRRAIKRYIELNGAHPGIAFASQQQQPFKHTTSKAERMNARRQERKERLSA